MCPPSRPLLAPGIGHRGLCSGAARLTGTLAQAPGPSLRLLTGHARYPAKKSQYTAKALSKAPGPWRSARSSLIGPSCPSTQAGGSSFALAAIHSRASATVTACGPGPASPPAPAISTTVPSADSVPPQEPSAALLSVTRVPGGSCFSASPLGAGVLSAAPQPAWRRTRGTGSAGTSPAAAPGIYPLCSAGTLARGRTHGPPSAGPRSPLSAVSPSLNLPCSCSVRLDFPSCSRGYCSGGRGAGCEEKEEASSRGKLLALCA
jgi:hypothetical protein